MDFEDVEYVSPPLEGEGGTPYVQLDHDEGEGDA